MYWGEDDTDSRFFQTNHCNRYPNSQFTRIHLKAISLMQSYLFFLNIAKYQESFFHKSVKNHKFHPTILIRIIISAILYITHSQQPHAETPRRVFL